MSLVSNNFSIVVLISGRGSNLGALIQAISLGHIPVSISCVVTDNPDAAGLKIAAAAGIKTAIVERQPKQLKVEDYNTLLADTVSKYNPQLIVLAGYMRVLRPEFISRFRDRIINIHPSLLPAFRGLDVQRAALEAGVKFAGCTVHFVEEEVDTGPIIAQAVVPVLEGDTVETLSARILTEEHNLLPAVVSGFAQGKIELINVGDRKIVRVDPALVSGKTEAGVPILKSIKQT